MVSALLHASSVGTLSMCLLPVFIFFLLLPFPPIFPLSVFFPYVFEWDCLLVKCFVCALTSTVLDTEPCNRWCPVFFTHSV